MTLKGTRPYAAGTRLWRTSQTQCELVVAGEGRYAQPAIGRAGRHWRFGLSRG